MVSGYKNKKDKSRYGSPFGIFTGRNKNWTEITHSILPYFPSLRSIDQFSYYLRISTWRTHNLLFLHINWGTGNSFEDSWSTFLAIVADVDSQFLKEPCSDQCHLFPIMTLDIYGNIYDVLSVSILPPVYNYIVFTVYFRRSGVLLFRRIHKQDMLAFSWKVFLEFKKSATIFILRDATSFFHATIDVLEGFIFE